MKLVVSSYRFSSQQLSKPPFNPLFKPFLKSVNILNILNILAGVAG